MQTPGEQTGFQCLSVNCTDAALALTQTHVQDEVDTKLIACERATADSTGHVKRAAGNFKMGCRQLQAITVVRAQIHELQRHVGAVQHLLNELEHACEHTNL